MWGYDQMGVVTLIDDCVYYVLRLATRHLGALLDQVDRRIRHPLHGANRPLHRGDATGTGHVLNRDQIAAIDTPGLGLTGCIRRADGTTLRDLRQGSALITRRLDRLNHLMGLTTGNQSSFCLEADIDLGNLW